MASRKPREKGEGVTTDGGNRPLVSVIVPAYNSAAYIRKALDSILEQDYPNKEVIVVDDGSSDGTRDVLAAYGDQIQVIHQENAGSAVARNQGLRAAAGDYIAFLDSDDVWLPGKLTAQVAYMERNPDIDMTYGRWAQWHPDADGRFPPVEQVVDFAEPDPSKIQALVPERSGWLYDRLLTDFIVWTSVVMARRRLIEQVGEFDPRYERGQDFDYWLRASRFTEIHMLDRPFGLYRQHADNSTHGCPERNFAAEIIDRALDRWGLTGPDGSRADRRQVNRHRARLWTGFAWKQRRAGAPGRALASLVRAVALRPIAPRVWLTFGLTVFETLVGRWLGPSSRMVRS